MALDPILIFTGDLIAIFAVYLIINLSLNLEFGFGGVPNFGKVLAVAAGAFVVGTIPFALYGAILDYGGLDPVDDNIMLIHQINAHITEYPEVAVGVFIITLLVAIVVGGIMGIVSAYPAIRLRGDYLAITLLGFGEVIRIIGINHTPLVGGTLGVSVPDMLSFVPNEYRFLIGSLVLLGFAGLVYLLVSRFTKSPVGRLLRSNRDDDVAVSMLGRDPVKIKFKVMMLAGMIGAVGGVMYASYVEGVVAFGYNRFNWTFLPFVMIIVGGMANNKGVLVGTLLFVAIRKLVIYYNDSLEGVLPFDIIWLDYLALGGVMILVLIFRPHGLIPEKPQKSIDPEKDGGSKTQDSVRHWWQRPPSIDSEKDGGSKAAIGSAGS